MENEDTNLQLGYDWNKLELARVAAGYLNEKGEKGLPFAKKSLELILKDIGVSDPILIKTITDPEVIQKTIKNQLEVYNKFKKDQTISELINYHSGILEDYLEKDIGKVSQELEPFMDKKYVDLETEIEKAQHLIKGKENYKIGSDEDIEKSKKLLENYGKVTTTIRILEERNNSKLKDKIEDATMKEAMQEMYSQEELEQAA